MSDQATWFSGPPFRRASAGALGAERRRPARMSVAYGIDTRTAFDCGTRKPLPVRPLVTFVAEKALRPSLFRGRTNRNAGFPADWRARSVSALLRVLATVLCVVILQVVQRL
jgi:hypothetical protein